MKKLCAVFFAVLLAVTLVSCAAAVPEQMPDDFNFVFTVNFTEADTYNGTLKNTYYYDEGDENAAVEFALTDAQMQEIYDAFRQYKVASLPEEIDPDKEYMSIPPSWYEFSYTCNGEEGSVSCHTGAAADQVGISRQNNDFVKFVDAIVPYLYDTEAFERLPDGPYME